MTKCIGIFGTAGMAREAGDIAWAIGIEPFYIARDDQELKYWSGAGEIILESEIEKVSNHPFVELATISSDRKLHHAFQNFCSFLI